MERKFQTLLDKILRQIFIKKLENSPMSPPETPQENLPAGKAIPAFVAFVIPGPMLQSRSPEYYRSPEYFARLRQKMRICFTQEKKIIQSDDSAGSFEKKIRIDEIDEVLEETVLLEYEDRSLLEKIARLEDFQEIYRKMVRNRQSGY